MKHLIMLGLTGVLAVGNCAAQQIRPITLPLPVKDRYEQVIEMREPGLTELKMRRTEAQRQLKALSTNTNDNDILDTVDQVNRQSVEDLRSHDVKFYNTRISEYNRATRKLIKEYTAEDLNDDPRLAIALVGGINSFGAGTVTGGFYPSISYRVTDYSQRGARIDPLYIYAAYNVRSHVSKDSAELSKAFLFPGIVRRDFVLGLFWQNIYPTRGLTIEYLAEGSLNQYERESVDNTNFRSESGILGIKFTQSGMFSSAGTAYTGSIQFFPYYGITNIQPKYFAGYNKAFENGSLPATWHTLGLQVAVQGSALQCYADMKYILNNTTATGIEDFQGMTYTIGTMVALNALTFRIWP